MHVCAGSLAVLSFTLVLVVAGLQVFGRNVCQVPASVLMTKQMDVCHSRLLNTTSKLVGMPRMNATSSYSAQALARAAFTEVCVSL